MRAAASPTIDNLWATALRISSDCWKAGRSNPSTNCSTKSLRYSSSRRIEAARLADHGVPNEGFEPVLGHQVNSAAEQCRQIQHQSGMIQKSRLCIRQKIDEQVNVAFRPHRVMSGRTEYGEFAHYILPANTSKLSFIHLNGSESHTCLNTIIPSPGGGLA